MFCRRFAFFVSSACLFCSDATAQQIMGAPPPPRSVQDRNSVSLYSATFSPTQAPISIGPNGNDLFFQRFWTNFGWRHNFLIYISYNYNNAKYTVNNGNYTDVFEWSGLALVSDQKTTLQIEGNNAVYINKLGEKTIFSGLSYSDSNSFASKIIKSDGEHIDLFYENALVGPSTITRLSSVVSSRGYQLKLTYISESFNSNQSDNFRFYNWGSIKKATLINNAYELCATVGPCSPAMDWPNISSTMSLPANFDTNTYPKNFSEIVVASNGQSTKYTYIDENSSSGFGTHITSIVQDGTPSLRQDITYKLSTPTAYSLGYSIVDTVTVNNNKWHYNFLMETLIDAVNQYGFAEPRNVSIIDPLNGQQVYYGDSFGRTYLEIDSIGRNRRFKYPAGYGGALIPIRLTDVEGNFIVKELDDRNNVNKISYFPKAGSNLMRLDEFASFSIDCGNRLTCNKPLSTTDATGRVVDFTYSPEHGGVLTETGAAVNGVRPQTRYAYVQRQAWIKASSGEYVQTGQPIWLLARKASCKTTAAQDVGCEGGATDELVTLYDYGAEAGPNNLWLRGVVEDANGAARRTCYAYDRQGNKISEAKPRAGLTSCP